MIPFKPKLSAYPGEHPLAGGTFPQPPALAALCSQLPPPVCFRGPFVAVDQLIDIFNRIQLPDGNNFSRLNHFEVFFSMNFFFVFTAPSPNGENGCDMRLFDLAKSVHWIVDDSTYSSDGGLKRRRIVPGGDDSDDEAQGPAPPANDIYRLRQQKRFNK